MTTTTPQSLVGQSSTKPTRDVRGGLRVALCALLALGVLLLALTASPAFAHTTLVGGTPVEQGWVDAAQMPTADVTITIHQGKYDPNQPDMAPYGAFAGADDLWLGAAFASAKPTNRTARTTLLHELGHVFDDNLMTDADRDWIGRNIFHSSYGWDTNIVDLGGSLKEKFADVYAAAAEGIKLRTHQLYWTPGYNFGIRGSDLHRFVHHVRWIYSR